MFSVDRIHFGEAQKQMAFLPFCGKGTTYLRMGVGGGLKYRFRRGAFSAKCLRAQNRGRWDFSTYEQRKDDYLTEESQCILSSELGKSNCISRISRPDALYGASEDAQTCAAIEELRDVGGDYDDKATESAAWAVAETEYSYIPGFHDPNKLRTM